MITGSGSRARDAGPGYGMPAWLARQVQALFAEARARRRRRRLAVVAVALASVVLAGTAVAGYLSGWHPGRAAAAPRQAPAHGRGVTLPSALAAWFDADGGLRIGNVATLGQDRVAQAGSQPCCRMILAGHRIYWAGQFRGRDYVQQYDLATGVIRNVAPGWAVFASASGRSVYIAQSGRRLLELSADGGRPQQLVTPPGWQVVPLPWAAAGGIVLSSSSTSRPVIGVWHPDTGTVKAVGHGRVLTTWTAPSGRSSLIAWQPTECPLQHCPAEITSTATGRTLTVRSPLRYGFLGQGNDMAFSPDGTELAALISINPLSPGSEPRFVPALVSTTTGTVRLVRRAVLANGELAGWFLWLPGSTRLVAGPAAGIGNYAGYAINARTGAARPFSFFPGSSYQANASADITYGAVLVPVPSLPRRARPSHHASTSIS